MSAEALKEDKSTEDSALIFDEIQLILSEKRTALSTLRTGIAVLILPLSVFSVLIATSRHYELFRVMLLLIPLLVLNVALIALGFYLVAHSIRRIHRYDRQIREIKLKHSAIAEFID